MELAEPVTQVVLVEQVLVELVELERKALQAEQVELVKQALQAEQVELVELVLVELVE